MATIQKRKNSYLISVSCGYDSTGKQIRHTTTWKPSPNMTVRQEEKELQRQATLFEEKCQNGQCVNENIKLMDFVELWRRDYAEKQLKPKSITFYNDVLRRIIPALGHLKMEKIRAKHLLDFYNNLAEEGIRDDNTYKATLNFKELLKARKMTKSALTKAAGVSISTIDSLTAGNNISSKSAKNIAVALGLKVTDCFESADTKPLKTLSQKTIQNHHRFLSSLFNLAVKWQIISNNPCNHVMSPKVDRKESMYIDEVEAANLISLLSDEPMQFQVAVKLLLYTGFRRAELLGLEWSDIDFKTSVIHVRRESLYLPNRGIYTGDGKTSTSIRSVKVAVSVMDMLKSYRAWQAEQRFQLGDQWTDTGRLFTKWDGTPMHPDTLTTTFSKFIKAHDLPRITIHSLRHTNATLLIANGTAVTTVAKRLGHANASTTTKIYAHAIRSADEAAAETLEDILTAPTSNRKNKRG